MSQSPHPFETRPSNSSSRSAEVYFALEEMRLGGDAYLTELTWSYRLARDSFDSYYPVRHPGAEEADELLVQMDPSYRPPQRYTGIVIAQSFLTDYDSLPKGTPIYGTSIDQCLALEEYLSVVPRIDRSYIDNFRVMEQELPDPTVRGMIESLRAIRTNSLGANS